MRAFACVYLLSTLTCLAQTATLTKEATPAEDPRLRAEAIRLMEQADRVSTPKFWPPNQQVIHFRIGQPENGQPFEGDYTSDIGGPGQRRQEWRYGTYNRVQVRNGNAWTTLHAEGNSPGFFAMLAELTPAWLGHFDHEDVIQSITSNADGGRCVQFATIFGDRRQQNEVCVDAKNGWLLSVQVGDKIIRNSNYFPFNGASLPGHVERWAGQTLVMKIDQTIVPKDYAPDFFGAPNVSRGCSVSTPPSPIDVPQPAQQNVSSNVVDVVLNGLVDGEGRISNLKPLDNLHPDLNQERPRLQVDLCGRNLRWSALHLGAHLCGALQGSLTPVRRGCGSQTNFKDAGPKLARHKKPLLQSVVRDPVQDGSGFPAIHGAENTGKVDPARDSAGPRRYARDAVGLPDIREQLAVDHLQLVQLVYRRAAIMNMDATFLLQRSRIQHADISGAVAQKNLTSVIGESPAFPRIGKAAKQVKVAEAVDKSDLRLPRELQNLIPDNGDPLAEKF